LTVAKVLCKAKGAKRPGKRHRRREGLPSPRCERGQRAGKGLWRQAGGRLGHEVSWKQRGASVMAAHQCWDPDLNVTSQAGTSARRVSPVPTVHDLRAAHGQTRGQIASAQQKQGCRLPAPGPRQQQHLEELSASFRSGNTHQYGVRDSSAHRSSGSAERRSSWQSPLPWYLSAVRSVVSHVPLL